MLGNKKKQGHSEGTSSVAFEALVINWHIEFINLFIVNCLKLNFCFPITYLSQAEENSCLWTSVLSFG